MEFYQEILQEWYLAIHWEFLNKFLQELRQNYSKNSTRNASNNFTTLQKFNTNSTRTYTRDSSRDSQENHPGILPWIPPEIPLGSSPGSHQELLPEFLQELSRNSTWNLSRKSTCFFQQFNQISLVIFMRAQKTSKIVASMQLLDTKVWKISAVGLDLAEATTCRHS